MEFILTIAFTLGISLLFISLAINSTTGYIAHYANFMASRTYLSYEDSQNNIGANLAQAKNQTKSTFSSYGLDALGVPSNSLKIIDQAQSSIALFRGTTVTYTQKLSMFSFVGGGQDAIFHSESFLGKEPTKIECLESICRAMGIDIGTCKSGKQAITIMDNGC
ncbi:MAG: hypothetical protein N4A33_09990 [Bacteriovoracaceae bacterium]|jgi:hypothetical protein|nr:hypothetical protein [Bacteriovoracaceae bacterium]